MSAISKQTAMDIALAYREIETGEKLLADVREASASHGRPTDIRDIFGRVRNGLQLGVPSGESGHRLFNVPYSLAIPVIETHIAHHRSIIAVLTLKAAEELAQPSHAKATPQSEVG
jgi:hypothetical protein